MLVSIDKTKTMLFSPKNAAPLIFKRNYIILKQHNFAEYLGCLLDNTLSGKDTAEKVLEKVNGRLKFLYRQSK